MKKSFISRILCSVSLLLVTSCSLFPGYAVLENHATTGSGWQGVLNSSENADVVNLFYLHGIGLTNRNFSQTLRETVKQAFGGSWTDGEPIPVALPQDVYRRGESLDCESKPQLCAVQEFGELQLHTFKQSGGGAEVRLFSYFWNDSAAELQKAYRMYCDEGSINTRECDRKDYSPVINASLRKSIVVNGLGDAAFYLGPSGKMFRQGLQAAICQAIHYAGENMYFDGRCTATQLNESDLGIAGLVNNANLHFVAKSLGSRVLFDTLFPADELDALINLSRCPRQRPVNAAANTFPEVGRCELFDDRGVTTETISAIFPATYEKISNEIEMKKALAKSLSEVYMFANQLPLLGLGRVQIGSMSEIEMRDHLYCDVILRRQGCAVSPQFSEPELSISANAVYENANSASPQGFLKIVNDKTLKIIAFRDPGDLLGFQGGMHLSEQALEDIEFYEVRRRNAFSWFLFSFPGKAHANEDTFEGAISLVFCGALNNGKRELKAKFCNW